MRYLIYFLLTTLLSCRTLISIEQNKLVEFSLWKSYVSKLIDTEVSNVPNQCPSIQEKAPYFKKIISNINLAERKKTIDSLVNNNKLSSKQVIVIYDTFIQGFNFYYCTKFAIYSKYNKDVKIFEICKFGLDPDFIEDGNSIFQNKVIKRREYKKELNIKSNCNIDGFYVITTVNNKSEIINSKVIIMP